MTHTCTLKIKVRNQSIQNTERKQTDKQQTKRRTDGHYRSQIPCTVNKYPCIDGHFVASFPYFNENGCTLQTGPALHYSVDLRIPTCTEPVPLKYGKLARKCPWTYADNFDSVPATRSVNQHRSAVHPNQRSPFLFIDRIVVCLRSSRHSVTR